MKPSESEKMREDKTNDTGKTEHERSYAAHTGHDGEQHLKNEAWSIANSHASETHPSGLKQPPEYQGRSGKSRR